MTVEYWKLPEIENYLIHPEAIYRFLEKNRYGGFFLESHKEVLESRLPSIMLKNPQEQIKASFWKWSDFLVQFLKDIKYSNTSKWDLYEIATYFNADEVFPEIQEILDAINIVL